MNMISISRIGREEESFCLGLLQISYLIGDNVDINISVGCGKT